VSWDDNPFDGSDDETREALRRWLGELLPESMFQQIEEMMDQMMRQMKDGTLFDPNMMEELMRDPKNTNPFVFGFSMKVGPDGKPLIQRFGNAPVDDGGSKMSAQLEPLVDIIEEPEEIIVVAELPGVDKDEIKVRIKGRTLTIEVDNPERPYHKSLELPSKVKKEDAKSAIRNGVLEVRLKKAL